MKNRRHIFPHVFFVALPLIFAGCFVPLFAQDWVPFDPPQEQPPGSSIPVASPTTFPYPFATQSMQLDETPNFSPDDPELARLLETRNNDYVAAKRFAEEGLKQYERLNEQAKAINRHIYESRKREILSHKPRTAPDGTTAGLDVFSFPELDGSTSCANLGAIVTARVLQIPYIWEMRNSQVPQPYRQPRFRRTNFSTGPTYHQPYYNSAEPRIEFQIVPDGNKTTFRQRNMFRDYFGQFQGTHQSYMSLIGPPKENANAHSHGTTPGALPPTTVVPTPNYYPVPASSMGYSSPVGHFTGSDENFPASDIILVARKPSQDELAAAEKAGVELDVRPIARDAFIFLVSRKNPVESLTLEEIQSIFASQQPRNWNEFGGNDQQIMPFERERNSGSRELMDELVVTPEAIEKYNPRPTPPGLQPGETPVQPSVSTYGQSTTIAPTRVQPFGSGTSTTGYTPPTQLVPPTPHTTNYPNPDPQNARAQSVFELAPGQPTATYQPYQPPVDSFRDHRPGSRSGFVGMGAPFMAVQQNKNTIAYSVYHYEHFMNCTLDTRILAVNGVMPSYETICSGEYPLCCDVYVVTRKDMANDSPAAKLRDWLLSDDGQNSIAESGYVPQRDAR